VVREALAFREPRSKVARFLFTAFRPFHPGFGPIGGFIVRAVGSVLLCTALATGLVISAASAYAQVVEGSGDLSGKWKNKFNSCKDVGNKTSITTDFTLFSDGRWISQDSKGHTFTGTSRAVGKGGKWNLDVDGTSKIDLEDRMYAEVDAACGGTGFLLAKTKKGQLKLNKKATKAKLILTHQIKSIDPVSIFFGRKYIAIDAIKAKGPWTAAP
jgi:hypothetical protein